MKPVEGIFVQEVKWYCSSVAEKYFLAIADATALFAVFWLAGAVALHSNELNTWGLDSSRFLSFFLLSLVTLALFKLKGHHAKRRPYSNEIREVLKIVLIMGLIDASLLFLGKRDSSRAALLMTWLLAPCFVLLLRGMVKFLLLKVGGWVRPMVIIGWGENALQTARAFDEEALMGYRLIAFLIPEGQEHFEHQYLNRSKQRVFGLSG